MVTGSTTTGILEVVVTRLVVVCVEVRMMGSAAVVVRAEVGKTLFILVVVDTPFTTLVGGVVVGASTAVVLVVAALVVVVVTVQGPPKGPPYPLLHTHCSLDVAPVVAVEEKAGQAVHWTFPVLSE